MGLADRDYLRDAGGSPGGWWRPRLWSFNTWLIVINVLVFVADPLLARYYARAEVVGVTISAPHTGALALGAPNPPMGGRMVQPIVDTATGQTVGFQSLQVMGPLQAWGHFSTAKAFVAFSGGVTTLGLEVWRFVTFQFLHSGWMHLLMNMLGLWVFGGMVEQQLGRRRYAAFYLMCGLCGGIMYLILNFLGNVLAFRIPGLLTGDPFTPLVGASAGVFGIIMAAAKIAPNEEVVLFPIPIPIEIRVLAWGYVLIALANLLFGGRNAGGDAAHVGGAIAGFIFIRRLHYLREFLDVLGNSRLDRREARDARAAMAAGGAGGDAEVDRILAKVASAGIGSLTSAEKRTLSEATERQRKARA